MPSIQDSIPAYAAALAQEPQAQSQPAPESKWPYAALLAGQGADALTTALATRNPNIHEGNPLGLGGVLAAKAGVSGLMAYLMHKQAQAGHPGVAKALGIIGGAAGAIPATLNARTMLNTK